MFLKNLIGHRRLQSLKDPGRITGGLPPNWKECYQDEMVWFERLLAVVAKLPWFGQALSSPPRARHAKGERLEQPDVQRVLLSWLAGGSATQIARRAGVSRRSAYKVVRRIIYGENPGHLFATWHDLGLIACLVTPGYAQERSTIIWQQVVCLICHEQVCSYDWKAPGLKVGDVFRPDLKRHVAPVNAHNAACAVQAHLILHFWLQKYPIPSDSLFGSRSLEDVWTGLDPRTGERVEQQRYIRESATRPQGAGVSREHEPWRHWRGGNVAAVEKTPLRACRDNYRHKSRW